MTQEQKAPVVHKIGNVFKSEEPAQPLANIEGTAIMATDIQRGIAEVQAAYMVAASRPRNPVMAMDRMLNECQRPSLAERAVYSYPRGGVEVTGPTIRLAEMLARQWGNIKCGWRVLDRKPGRSLIHVYAMDLETNFLDDLTFEVPHYRDTKQGRKPLTDDRDIYEMEANQAARRLRKCILTLIPGDIIDACLDQCEMTMSATSSNEPAQLQKMLSYMASFGVNKAMIEARIGRKFESMTQAQVAGFKKIATSLKDGMTEAKDWFDMSLADKQPVDVKDTSAAAKKRGPRKGKGKEEANPDAKPEQETKPENLEQFKEQEKAKEDRHIKPQEPEQQTQPEQETPKAETKPEETEGESCAKCGGSGMISEVTDEGEIIDYACSRCS